MLTSPNIKYGAAKWNMAREYLAATESEVKVWSSDAPFGYGCIDAPDSLSAGSTECYEFASMPGVFTELPTTARRFM